MKKVIFLFSFFLTISVASNSQIQLWGMSGGGGTSGVGTIFKCTPTVSSISTVLSFGSDSGARPFGSLIQGTDGYMYGMTLAGGTSNDGAIFKCTASGSLTTMASFNGKNGNSPYGSLVQGTDGNLYGMTVNGGPFDSGEIFQCTPSGIINPIVYFNGEGGIYPYGNLIQGTDGNLYGMTMYGGGEADSGTIFKCTTSGVLTTLVNFNSLNGGFPYGSLIQGTDDNLYGMTLYGGTSDSGTIFKCTTSGVLTTLVNLNGSTGCYPYGNLIQAFDGNLYGMTETGGAYNGGTIFKCSTTGVFKAIVNLNDSTGQNPLGSLMQASDSNFYGMTSSGGGRSGSGTVFQYTPSGNFTVLDWLIGAIFACSPVRQYGNLLEVNPVLGINTISTTSKTLVYPNPASNTLNVLIDIQAFTNTGVIKIIDITGKEVLSKNVNIANGQLSIDISTLTYGMYFAEVVTDKNKEVFKFVKE